jgi:hypothetical protein
MSAIRGGSRPGELERQDERKKDEDEPLHKGSGSCPGRLASGNGGLQRAASLTEPRRAFRRRGHYICVMPRAASALGRNFNFFE